MRPLETLRAWPDRRWVVALVLVLPVFTLLRSADPSTSMALDVITGLTAAAGALLLASYVPGRGEGRRSVIGCTPCATVAALTLLGAVFLRANAPGALAMSVVALALPVMGLGQRLKDAGTCIVPNRDHSDATKHPAEPSPEPSDTQLNA